MSSCLSISSLKSLNFSTILFTKLLWVSWTFLVKDSNHPFCFWNSGFCKLILIKINIHNRRKPSIHRNKGAELSYDKYMFSRKSDSTIANVCLSVRNQTIRNSIKSIIILYHHPHHNPCHNPHHHPHKHPSHFTKKSSSFWFCDF